MKYLVIVLFFLNFCALKVNGRKLPSFVKRCDRSDPELNDCMKNAILKFRKYLPKGVNEMRLPALDPFNFESATFDVSFGKAVLTNLRLYYPYDFEVDDFDIDLDNDTISMRLTQKYMELHAHYKLDGQFLQFGLSGEGEMETNFTDTKTSGIMTGRKVQKKGKEYLMLENIDFKLLENSLEHFYFHDLFRDNQPVTDWFHRLLNENMNELAVEVMPLIEEFISKIYLSFFKNVFDTFPLDDLFI